MPRRAWENTEAGEKEVEIIDRKLAKYITQLEKNRRTALSGRIDEQYWEEDVARKVQKRLKLKEEIDEIMIDEDNETVLINVRTGQN